MGAATAVVLVGGLPGNAVSHGDEGKGTEKKGEAERPVRRHDVSHGWGRPPHRLPQNQPRLAAPNEGIFRLPHLQELPASCSGGLTGGQRRRLSRDVNEACRALSWMHGEEIRPPALPPSLVASEDKNQCLRADVQQRVMHGSSAPG